MSDVDVGTLAKIVSLTVALTAPITTLLTLWFTKGTEAWRIKFEARKAAEMERLRESREAEMNERTYSDEQTKKVYDLAVSQFGARVTYLEGELKRVTDKLVSDEAKYQEEIKVVRKEQQETADKLNECKEQHAECLIKQEELKGDLKALYVHVERLWSHDKVNKEQILMNRRALEERLGISTNALEVTNLNASPEAVERRDDGQANKTTPPVDHST